MARALLLLISALAAISCAAAQLCGTDRLGRTDAQPVELPIVSVSPGKQNYATAVRQTCALRLQHAVGVEVAVCSLSTPRPTARLTNLDYVEITSTWSATVLVTAYCSPVPDDGSPLPMPYSKGSVLRTDLDKTRWCPGCPVCHCH